MTDICIGIISYLLDGETGKERFGRLTELVKSCHRLFDGAEIIIIAQNWKNADIKGATVLRYDKLGITQARKALREVFLTKRTAVWLICFDDDNILEGSTEDGKAFLRFLGNAPDGSYLTHKREEFKLCALSRKLLEKVEIPSLEPEKFEGYEDMAFFGLIRQFYPEEELRYDFKTLKETSMYGYLPTYRYGDISKGMLKSWRYILKKCMEHKLNKTEI